MTTIGILREEKTPADSRTPLTPNQAADLQKRFADTKVYCQSSRIRCYTDSEYEKQGIEVTDQLDHCDILLGIKEVPEEMLISKKTYFFFSHTIKKQSYNRLLLQSILRKKIRLIDYECIRDRMGLRIISFGRWAGIIGAYNCFWTIGKKYGKYSLPRAHEIDNYDALVSQGKKVISDNLRFVVTGGGRVAKGVVEILDHFEIQRVRPSDFLSDETHGPVYTQIYPHHYNQHIKSGRFHFKHFIRQPQSYGSIFMPYANKADVLIGAAYWDPRAPKLFNFEEVQDKGFRIRTIADITCDINGSIPTTVQSCSIKEPVYDFDPVAKAVLPAFSNPENISVMAVDNLPSEMPRASSESFGNQLLQDVLPLFFISDPDEVIQGATIASDGKLLPRYDYLEAWVNGSG
jgi:alanine dehydrogenase